MKKIFLILAISVAVLLIVISVIVGLYLGPIVKIGIEQVGPKVTQVPIKVDAVDVSLITGSAAIKGLVVGNPSGYTTPQSMSVGTVSIKIDPMSVTSSKIIVHSIEVESPEITFEGGLGRNNLSQILDNVKKGGPASSNSGTSNKPAPKIEVDDFLIKGAKVHVALSGLVNKEIPLPDIHLTDLGRDNNGMTPAELTGAIISAISKETLTTVTGSLSSLSQNVQGLTKGAGKTVSDSLNKITSNLGGLLGK